MAGDGYKVTLNVYDLSQGLARQLSATFLGKTIEAIWHTGLVVYGIEYYYGAGIQQDPAGCTPYGNPIKMVDLGETLVPKEVFEQYLQEIAPRYTAESYKLLSHNCNNFSNEIAQFLVGTSIPDYILQLPNEVLSSPMGPLMLPMIQNLEMTMRSGAVPQAPQFRPPVSTTTVSSLKADDQAKDSAAPAATTEKEAPVAADPMGDARRKIQDEITKEFAGIMASGTLRASEAAALATRRVMARHGMMDSPVQEG